MKVGVCVSIIRGTGPLSGAGPTVCATVAAFFRRSRPSFASGCHVSVDDAPLTGVCDSVAGGTRVEVRVGGGGCVGNGSPKRVSPPLYPEAYLAMGVK